MYTFTFSVPEPQHQEGERVLLKDVSKPQWYNPLRDRVGQVARITNARFTGMFILDQFGSFIGPPINGEWEYTLVCDDGTYIEYGERRNTFTELTTVEEA